jgi:phycocyanin-associated rod linker protein
MGVSSVLNFPVGIENVNFNRTFALDRGFPSYDAASQQAKLISEVVGNAPSENHLPC